MLNPTLFVILILANLTEAITGFGSTVIALTLGAFFFPIEYLIRILVPLNLVLSVILVWQSRRHIDAGILVRKILPFTGLGMALGLFLQKSLQQSSTVQKGYGVFVFIFASYQLLLKSHAKDPSSTESSAISPMPVTRANGAAAHFTPIDSHITNSHTTNPPAPTDTRIPKPITLLTNAGLLFGGGVMQGIYASGGPLVVSYASQVMKDKDQFRATLSFLWILLNGLLFGLFIREGVYSDDVRHFALVHFPAVLLGLWAGNTLHRRIQERAFRRLVFVLLMVAGLALALR